MELRQQPEVIAVIMAAIGGAIGLAKVLAEESPVPLKVAIGRALLNSALGLAGGLIYLIYPETNLLVLLASSAGLASLGTDGLMRIFKRVLGKDGTSE